MRSATGQKFWLSLGLMTAIGSPGIVAVEILGAMGAIAFTATAAQAATLSNWSFNPNTNQLEVLLPAGVQPRYFLVAEPARIVLDLPSTQVGAVPTEGSYGGAIQQIRVAQFQPDLARIVLQLSPDTVLAPGQVQLEKVGSVEQGAQRWTLRPLVADAASPITASEPAQPAPTAIAPPSIISPAPTPLLRSEVSTIPTGLPPALAPIAPSPSTVAVPESASLPPVSPGAVSIPVENPPEEPRTRPSASDRRSASRGARQARRDRQEARRVERQSVAQSTPQPASQQPPIAPALPPATFTPPVARTVNVPALNPPVAPMTLAANDSIPFGQPLPGSPVDTPSAQPTQEPTPPQEPTVIPDRPNDSSTNSAPPITELSVDATFNTLIPADTELSLYYPQDTPLDLTTEPQDEVLFLAQNVRDRAGNLLVPVDSQVIGRFESNSDGSQFIARSIRIQGENRPVSAESDFLGGGREEASGNRIVRNSAAGAVVGLLLGLTTGIGVLAGVALGALSGAGSVLVSDPQTAVIQPNQVIEVRLLEDLPR
ncbi:MAG: AMIN domain-containing protein [Timaviella obliquedivisa GSE-PSE-MK23-08B]|nr:AMIN domain-containing protein [Timaviella obliquedivisa GSE-PSE-MK23-08B]